MKTKTITVNVEEDVEEKFRKLASVTYGRRKGYLGKALTEAMREWERKKAETDVNARALKMLEKGFNLGGITYKKRAELHERK
jgi:predicted transcriptional regulator